MEQEAVAERGRDGAMRKLARNVHVRLIAVSCAVVLLFGCQRGTVEITAKDGRRVAEIKELISKVCGCERDHKPMEDGMRVFREVVAMTNAMERKKWLMVVCDAISTTRLKGYNISERQVSYAHLHYFREKASELLGMAGDDLWWRLEMWFAEVEAFRKEAAFCDAMVADINAAFKGNRHSKIKLPPDFNDAVGLLCEWEASAQQSKHWHEYDMAPIILWDDSVAAKYCATLPWWKKMMVVRRIKNAIGRYPDWYLNEKKSGHTRRNVIPAKKQ